MEMFQKASKMKLRFVSAKGELTTEDLWDLSLTSLDTIAKGVNKKLKESEEESFIQTKTTANTESQLRLDILKEVIAVKIAAQEAAKLRAEKQAKLAQLKDLVASKQNEAMASKSLEELQAMIAENEIGA